MNCFDSDMSKSTNTVVRKSVIYILVLSLTSLQENLTKLEFKYTKCSLKSHCFHVAAIAGFTIVLRCA